MDNLKELVDQDDYLLLGDLTKMDPETLGLCEPVLLVTGKKSFERSGAMEKCREILKGIEHHRFSDFSVNPKLTDVYEGLRLIEKKGIKSILAIGGGSALDMGKLLRFFAYTSGDISEVIQGKRKRNKSTSMPLCAVPSTAGSGSEATHFAVVYIHGKKYSLADLSIKPDHVVLDSSLSYSMSARQTAYSGLDAISQSLESLWSVNGNDISRDFAANALEILNKNFLQCVHKPNQDNRKQMLIGSYYAGKAIDISKTTGPHAFSYYLTSKFGIPHGHSVALFIPAFFRINGNSSDSETRLKMERIYSIIGVKDFDEAQRWFLDLIESCKLSSRVQECVNLKEVFDDFFSSVNLERLTNNPENVDREVLYNYLLGENE